MPHASMQGRIMFALQAVTRDAGLGGEVMPECPVVTADGVKVPDVVWLSRGQANAFAGKMAAPAAPDICVEVKSPSNSKREMDAKRALYFGAGAKEVWICDGQGTLTFWSATGKIRRSRILAAFPARIGST